MQAFMW